MLDAVNGKLVVQQCPLGIKCFVAHLQCSIYNIVIIQVDFLLISLLLEDISFWGEVVYRILFCVQQKTSTCISLGKNKQIYFEQKEHFLHFLRELIPLIH